MSNLPTGKILIGTTEFEIAKHVTLPQLKLNEAGEPNFIKFESTIAVAKDLQSDKGGRAPKPKAGETKEDAEKRMMAPPDVAEVVNLATGELGMLIVNAVLKSNLTEKYPNDAYVGKMFQIRKFKPEAKKRYFTFEILEIRPKGGASSAPATGAKTANNRR
jgi:hypothetical protein